VTMSALTGRGSENLLPEVLAIHDIWNTRVSTSKLNDWLNLITEEHPPPLASGRRIRLRYMTQPKTRPPTFAIFVNRPEKLPDSYLRYLANRLRQDFNLPGVPLRLATRKGKNPYAK
ncbi:MAG: ribosome biogenesis GTPase Der, partial [Rhodospirillales bacterium]